MACLESKKQCGGGNTVSDYWTRISSSLLIAFFAISCGAVREREVVTAPPAYAEAQTASIDELVSLVNDRYADIRTMTVSRFEVEFTGGSIEDGYLEKYRKADGYFVAEEPSSIFVNILNPLTNSSVLVMASHDQTFQIWIPSRNQFVVGSTDVPPDEENPVYNVRPSHIVEGILIEPIPVNDSQYKYSFEEQQDDRYKYYVLAIYRLRKDSPVLELVRRIWVERSAMELVRQQYYNGGEVVSIMRYGTSVPVGEHLVSQSVTIERPVERYAISFDFDTERVVLDKELKQDSFVIEQPAGSELVFVEEPEPMSE